MPTVNLSLCDKAADREDILLYKLDYGVLLSATTLIDWNYKAANDVIRDQNRQLVPAAEAIIPSEC